APPLSRWERAIREIYCNSPISLSPALQMNFPFIQTPRPVLFKKSRHRAICQQSAFGLASRAVVAFVVRIDNALNRRTADGTWFAITAMHSHLRTECRDFGWELGCNLSLQSVDPFR